MLFTAARKALHARTSTRQSHGTRDKQHTTVRYNESARSNANRHTGPRPSSAILEALAGGGRRGASPHHHATDGGTPLATRYDGVRPGLGASAHSTPKARAARIAMLYGRYTHVEKCLREIRSPASRLRPPHCHTVLAGVPVLTRAAAWRRGCEGCAGRG